ncbi:MAG: hypothetical protein EDR02_13720, partial [Actinobacteria bacterium]
MDSVTVAALDVDGSLTISSSYLSVTGESEINVLAVAGGVLTGAGQVTVTGAFTWTGGTLAGPGGLIVGPSASGALTGPDAKILGRPLRNDGSMVWSDGNIVLQTDLGDAHLDNFGTFEVSGDDQAAWDSDSGAAQVTNRPGASVVKSGTGVATLGNDGTGFSNQGTVEVSAGELRVGGDASSGGPGSWVIDGGTLTFAEGSWELSGNVSGVGAVHVAGATVRLSGGARFGEVGTLSISAGTLDLDNSPGEENLTSYYTQSGGTLSGDGDLQVVGDFNWSGGSMTGAGTLVVAVDDEGYRSISGPALKLLGRHLRNDGALDWTDGVIGMDSTGGNAPHLDNYGTFTITGDDVVWMDEGSEPGLVTNRPGATILKNGGGPSGLGEYGDIDVVNEGTVTVANGELHLYGTLAGLSGTTLTGGTWYVADGTTLAIRGADIVTNAADITLAGPDADLVDDTEANALRNLAVNEGTLSIYGKSLTPSGDLTNSGTLHLGDTTLVKSAGDFTQTAAGRLEIDISGPVPAAGHGVLNPAGGATVDGTISATLIAPFVPEPSDEFVVLDASSLTGAFATVEGGLVPSYDIAAGDVTLALPNPSSDCDATWDGGGLTNSWHNAANWDPDGLPGPDDKVCIPEGASVVYSSGTSTVSSISGDGALTLTSGSLEITGESTVASLTVSNGILDGAGDVTVSDAFTFAQGTLQG